MMPAAKLTSALISYLQFLFSKVNKVGAMYLWNQDQKLTKIRISSAFVIDVQKPLSNPYITVQRGGMNYQKVAIANFIEGDALENKVTKGDFLGGGISITVGARTTIEASNIAHFIAEYMQVDRGQIISKSGMLRNFQVMGVGPETPKVVDSMVHRAEVTISIMAETICLNEVSVLQEGPFNITDILGIDWRSGESKGDVASGVLNIGSKTVGIDNTYDYFLEQVRIDSGEYYAMLNGEPFQIGTIVDEHNIGIIGCSLNKTVDYSIIWNSSGINTGC